MHFIVAIEESANNFSAYAPALMGCTNTGKDFEEVISNIKDAIAEHLLVMQEYDELIYSASVPELFGKPKCVTRVGVNLPLTKVA